MSNYDRADVLGSMYLPPDAKEAFGAAFPVVLGIAELNSCRTPQELYDLLDSRLEVARATLALQIERITGMEPKK